jgi:hypothetical protein
MGGNLDFFFGIVVGVLFTLLCLDTIEHYYKRNKK